MARSIALKPIVNLPAGKTIDATVLYDALDRSRQSIYYLRVHADFPSVFGRRSGKPHYDTTEIANWLRANNVKIYWV
ncbi:hypothetical protein [Primorskyibacter sp. 2E233]|uniref:hypothetical protein n=1 Tax=Primorskyibacter sp. 2E233 TaxID=3413431 RepID=UPI003BF16366